MKTIVIKIAGALDNARAFIDDVELFFDGGEARQNRPPGEHGLTWFVRGTPGTQYTIEIADPVEARFKREDTIDSSTKDAGVKWFRVGG